jgi:hypothetical protein
LRARPRRAPIIANERVACLSMRAVLVALLLLAGCATNRGEIREVRRPAPPSPPKKLRFELVETATVETGSKVALAFPLASSEAGVQDIERLDVTINPDVPYEVKTDARGNRVLHLESAGPVAVQVTYRVLRTELRAATARPDDRPLTEAERRSLAPELEPTQDPELAALRRAGRPARRGSGIRLTESDTSGHRSRWIEIYTPGLAWAPFDSPVLSEKGVLIDAEARRIRVDVLIVSHGSDAPLPRATVDSVDTTPRLTFKARMLEAP